MGVVRRKFRKCTWKSFSRII